VLNANTETGPERHRSVTHEILLETWDQLAEGPPAAEQHVDDEQDHGHRFREAMAQPVQAHEESGSVPMTIRGPFK
jgi:hypothetical protein